MNNAEDVKIELKLLAFFSGIRFANAVKKVYTNFHEDFLVLITRLEDIQKKNCCANAAEREKAIAAAELSNNIHNKMFMTILAGTYNIYEIFGHGANILQKVNMLPKTKCDLGMEKYVNKLK